MNRGSYLHRDVSRRVSAGVSLVIALAEAVSFWVAVVFPLFYAFGYLVTVAHPGVALPSLRVIGALIGLNLLVLVVGHRYERVSRPTTMESPPTPTGRTNRGE